MTINITGMTIDFLTEKFGASGTDNHCFVKALDGKQYGLGGDGEGFNGDNNGPNRSSSILEMIDDAWSTFDPDSDGVNIRGGTAATQGGQLLDGKSYCIKPDPILSTRLWIWWTPYNNIRGYRCTRVSYYDTDTNTFTLASWVIPGYSNSWGSDDNNVPHHGGTYNPVKPSMVNGPEDPDSDFWEMSFTQCNDASALKVQTAGDLYMARVRKPTAEDPLAPMDELNYHWMTSKNGNEPVWSGDGTISAVNLPRHVHFHNDDGAGWAHSVNYLAKLDKYLLITEANTDGASNDVGRGRLGFWQADYAWGPWSLVFQFDDTNFFGGLSSRVNRGFYAMISEAWTEVRPGQGQFTLIWTGTGNPATVTGGTDAFMSLEGNFGFTGTVDEEQTSTDSGLTWSSDSVTVTSEDSVTVNDSGFALSTDSFSESVEGPLTYTVEISEGIHQLGPESLSSAVPGREEAFDSIGLMSGEQFFVATTDATSVSVTDGGFILTPDGVISFQGTDVGIQSLGLRTWEIRLEDDSRSQVQADGYRVNDLGRIELTLQGLVVASPVDWFSMGTQ